jgi:hypothetical protein
MKHVPDWQTGGSRGGGIQRRLQACRRLSIGIDSNALALPSDRVLRRWPVPRGSGQLGRRAHDLDWMFYREFRRRAWARCRDPARIPSRTIALTPTSGHTISKMIRSMASARKDLTVCPRMIGVISTSG